MQYQALATKEEIAARRRDCWSPPCKRKAFLEDWAGWKWCIYHWWFNWRWGGGNTSLWWYIRHTKVF